jgi:hypothetical protein
VRKRDRKESEREKKERRTERRRFKMGAVGIDI